MIYGKNSSKTVPVTPRRKNKTVFMPPSMRHNGKKTLGNRKNPFCHYLASYVRIEQAITKTKYQGYVVSVWEQVARTYPHKKTLPYHATKGFRKVSSKRL